MKHIMKKILIDNIRDLGIFGFLTASGLLTDMLSTLIGALIIIFVNTILLPIIKKGIKKYLPEAFHDEASKLADEYGKELVDKIREEIEERNKKYNNSVDKIKEEIEEERNKKNDTK